MSDDITPNQDEVPNSDGFPKKLGRYKIERLIGEGSFAHVYLAQDHLRPVALKVLKRKYVVDEAFVKRFLAEARTSVRLENEHIIRIYDQEVIDNFHFIAMEYAKGGDLAQYLQQQEKKLSKIDIKAFVKQIASALDFAHKEGFVHRDIKPSNILLGHNKRIKLADFGIALAAQVESTMPHYSSLNAGVGTGAYMAPEQVNPQNVTYKSDIYAFGVVVYEMLTGRLPFTEEVFFDLINQKRKSQFLPMPQEIPSYIQDLIVTVLDPQPDRRPDSAGEFADQLLDRIQQWEKSTKESYNLQELAGRGVTAMVNKEWLKARDHWENYLAISDVAYARENLAKVNLHIALDDARAIASESFDQGEWQQAKQALEEILRLAPHDDKAPVKLKEVETQIELQQLYQRCEDALISSDYVKAIQLLHAIHNIDPHYRDTVEKLEEVSENHRLKELTNRRELTLKALVVGNLSEVEEQIKIITELAPEGRYGTAAFLNQIRDLANKKQREIQILKLRQDVWEALAESDFEKAQEKAQEELIVNADQSDEDSLLVGLVEQIMRLIHSQQRQRLQSDTQITDFRTQLSVLQETVKLKQDKLNKVENTNQQLQKSLAELQQQIKNLQAELKTNKQVNIRELRLILDKAKNRFTRGVAINVLEQYILNLEQSAKDNYN